MSSYNIFVGVLCMTLRIYMSVLKCSVLLKTFEYRQQSLYQCSGSGSVGSVCFWACWIRIQIRNLFVRIWLLIRIWILLSTIKQIWRKTSISTTLWFLVFEECCKCTFQKIIFRHLKVNDEKSRIQFRIRIRIRTKISRIRNTRERTLPRLKEIMRVSLLLFWNLLGI